MAPTTISDLPFELLLKICSELDLKALLCVASICRLFQDVARPIIAKQQTEHLKFLQQRGDLVPTAWLPGRHSTFMASIKLTLNQDATLPKTTYSLYGFLSRTSYIGHVELHHPPFMLGEDMPGIYWTQVSRVLDVIAERPLSTLTVRGLAHRDDNTGPPGSKLLKKLKSILSPAPRHQKTPARNPTSSSARLHTFHIHSSLLLSPQLLPWTLDTLDTAPIHTLSFDGNCLWRDWTDLLPSITIPTLREFSVDSSGPITFSHIQRFLMRHPSITILDFCRMEARWLKPCPPSILPELIKISGRPELLACFLRPRTLPRLKHVKIAPGRRYHDFNGIFWRIAMQRRDVSLSLVFSHQFGLVEWLEDYQAQPLMTMSDLKVRFPFTVTARLEHAVVEWLAAFPLLHHLTIVSWRDGSFSNLVLLRERSPLLNMVAVFHTGSCVVWALGPGNTDR